MIPYCISVYSWLYYFVNTFVKKFLSSFGHPWDDKKFLVELRFQNVYFSLNCTLLMKSLIIVLYQAKLNKET